MHEAVLKLWPEIEWIKDHGLRDKVTKTWELALMRSPLTADDLNRIPFTLLVPNCPTTFMEHKRCDTVWQVLEDNPYAGKVAGAE